MRRLLALALAAALVGAGAAPALAEDDYPSRPITMIIPFPPGGVADQTARAISAPLEKKLNRAIAIRNVGGAGGAVGMAVAASSKPDGYTILLALSSISIIPEADKIFGRTPAYTVDQLRPIALLGADPTILVVRGDAPWKSLKEFEAAAKAEPGKYSFSSSGVYGTLHMAMAMFTSAAGIKMKHVPFNGAGPAVTAIIGGHVDALASGPGPILAHIQTGKLRALANWGTKRIAVLPDVPTFAELGYKDVEFYIWAGLFAPKDVPAPIMAKLREAVKAAAATPEFVSAMEKLGSPVAYLDAPDFEKFWAADAARLTEAVKRVGKVE
ncbi:MAG: tripartite tricarboxylate transporter substrate binding protein [Candidatus Rokubacteria bacterium]|nr:tripartite tricarboxylate transporter substrate binding protein [Candidatus Rokubacteria bacterium]